MSLTTRKRRSAARQMIDLARRRGDGGVALLPGAAQAGMHWLARDCGLGVSLNPTAGTLGGDGVTRASAAWLAAYVESTASTPAAVDGPVGFLSDGEGTVGAELCSNPGGPFTSTAGWSAYQATNAVTGGEIVLTSTVAMAGNNSQSLTLVPNTTYRVVANVRNINAGSGVVVLVQRGAAGGYAAISISSSITSTSSTQVPFTFVAPASDAQIVVQINASAVGQQVAFSSFSIKPLTGRHATQATGPNKPVMRRGLVNGLTWSNDLTNAAWVKSNGATASVGTIGFVNTVGSRIVEAISATASTVTGAVQFNPADAGKQIYLGLWASALDGLTTGKSTIQTIPSNGLVVYTWTGVSGSVTNFGLIWDTSAQTFVQPLVGLFSGTLTAQQILALGGIPQTTTIAASGTGGNYALEFGGSVTQLAGSFAPTTAATIIAAVRPNSLSGSPVLVGQPTGGAYLSINSSGGVTAGINGGQTFSTANGLIVAGQVYVITVRIAVNGTSTIRINGVTVATSTAITTAMNQTTVSIGSNGSGAFLAGLMGPVLEFTSALSDAETLVLERGAGALAPILGVKF